MKKNLPLISFLISLFAGCGVAVEILLSETMFHEIEEFSETPPWYQILMFVFLFIGLIGIILSFIFRNVNNTKKIERSIELVGLGVGALLMFGCALLRMEAYFLDVLISVGGVIFFISLFGFISTQIGLSRKKIK